MKKILIGCGVISLLVSVLLIGVLVYGIVKVKSFKNEVEETRAKFVQLDSQFPYTPPADGKLDDSRLNAWFEVREAMVARLLAEPLVKRFVEDKTGNVKFGVGDAMELPSLGTRLADALHQELSDREMPPTEYAEMIRLVYSTINQGHLAGNPTMIEIYDKLDAGVEEVNDALLKANQGDKTVKFGVAMGEIPAPQAEILQHNMDLVAGHRLQLQAAPQLSFLELLLLTNMGGAKPVVRLPPTAPSAAPEPATP